MEKDRQNQQDEQILELQELKRYMILLSRKKEQEHLDRLQERALKRLQKKSIELEKVPKTLLPSVQPSPVRKSKTLSNRLLIRNALVHVCLAGKVNEKTKEEVLEARIFFNSGL